MRFESKLQTHWDARAAGNFILGGSGSGLMILAVLAALPGAPSPLVLLVSLALVGAGLALVWLEVGRPARAFNVLRHGETSWMTREGALAALLMACGLGAAAGAVAGLAWAAGVFAAAFLFAQTRILAFAKGIPAWREPALAPFVGVTGLAEGAALLLLLGVAAAWLPYALLVLVVLRALAWVQYRGRLAASRAPAAALAALQAVNAPVLLLGHALPAALLILGLSLGHPWPVAAAALLALASGWHAKFVIVTRAAYQQGFALGRLRRGHPLGMQSGAEG